MINVVYVILNINVIKNISGWQFTFLVFNSHGENKNQRGIIIFCNL